MSKITLGELWEKLDKNELGTEKARVKHRDYGGRYGIVLGLLHGAVLIRFDGQSYTFTDYPFDTKVEWPIQEKKEKVLKPVLISYNILIDEGRKLEIKQVVYIKNAVEMQYIYEVAFDGFKILKWNPEGYQPITVKE